MNGILEMTKAQRIKANVSNEDFKRASATFNREQKELASLAGKTVRTATFTNPPCEGLYKLEFTDGSTAEFTASGDDMTFVHMNFTSSEG
jgi:hypothetical protein